MVLNYATFSMYIVKLIFLQTGEINLGLLAAFLQVLMSIRGILRGAWLPTPNSEDTVKKKHDKIMWCM